MSHFSLRILLPLLLLFLFCVAETRAQGNEDAWLNDDWYFRPEIDTFFDLTNFLPRPLRDEVRLKRYLRDDRFFALRKFYDDTLAVDAIFDRAMLIADNDVQHALFISTVAVMDHRRLGLRLPIIGAVYLPLTAEDDSLFRIRRTHLPKKLLDDNLRASDKDKLQHFFGSAYVAFRFHSNAIAEWIGDLLEDGEQSFVLGGRDDARDKLANERGREFGLRLLHDPRVLPSDILWKKR